MTETQIQILVEIIILLSTLYLIFFKNYFKKKGENLATKEDIGDITQKVESVKIEYQKNLEEIKSQLNIVNKKNEILLNEKVRTFLEIQKKINDCKKYCEARYGDYLGSDFHPNTDSIPDDTNKSLLSYSTELHYLERDNFIFLTEKSRNQIRKVVSTLTTHCNMEIAIMDKEFESEHEQGIMESYKTIETELNELLELMYEELNNNA
ncbi:hypothetical protein F6A46_12560 [Tenacibaculum finnmarkense genomovar ulcerans]|uniref:hypothetical protein n=1 Tax=Tenacibaculum finnmarkense TaxID=2781243 RepID=UPI00187B3BB8|nr:hypothetical protein [Tenacibaculum finnmarkense]MBE7689053.1 hypothetical protein [Tenacibaculum finnmarkense genomovar ulcerans]